MRIKSIKKWGLGLTVSLSVLAGCSALEKQGSKGMLERHGEKVEHKDVGLKENYMRAAIAMIAAEQTLIDFRHDLHRYPELSGQEKRTSSKIAAQLEVLGFDVRTEVGGYGVVGIMKGPEDGPVLAFRADMDATPDQAVDDVPYASEVEGVHHICGHDVHTTIGIGLATGFAAIHEDLPGTVMLIFQPAEETGTGANAMLADNVFVDYKPDAILSVHTAPLNTGYLATTSGSLMAGRAKISVKLMGSGNLAEAEIQVRAALNKVSTVKALDVFNPAPPDFISVTLSAAPEQPNVGVATVKGYVMSAGLARRDLVKTTILEGLNALSLDGVKMAISYEQALEGVNNDPNIEAIASAGIAKLVDNVEILPLPYVIPAFSEDFGSFQREVPGTMYFLGVNNPNTGTIGMPHTPNYVADDSAIMVGAQTMLAAGLTLMEQK